MESEIKLLAMSVVATIVSYFCAIRSSETASLIVCLGRGVG